MVAPRTARFALGAGLVLGLWSLTGAALETRRVDVYPLDTCVVTGAKLGSMGAPVTHQHGGRTVRFCCQGCVAKFSADPAPFLKKIDAEIIRHQLPHYPLDTCLVNKGKLGSMGNPINHVHNGHLVRFCCAGCVGTFRKEPARFLAQLDAAAVARHAKAPVQTCLVTGHPLGDTPIHLIACGRLVSICSEEHVTTFVGNPLHYLQPHDSKRHRGSTGQGSHAPHAPSSGHQHGTSGHGGHGSGCGGGGGGGCR